MTPTEAEILLSSKLAEKRSSVLSDEQAEEVSLRFTGVFKALPFLHACKWMRGKFFEGKHFKLKHMKYFWPKITPPKYFFDVCTTELSQKAKVGLSKSISGHTYFAKRNDMSQILKKITRI